METQRGMRRTPARYEFDTEDEELREDGFDDAWLSRTPSSARRYQGLADVRHETGHVADVQVQQSRRGHTRPTSARHPIPPRRTATQGSMPALQDIPPARASEEDYPRTTERYGSKRAWTDTSSQRRYHWLVFSGFALLIMILGWVVLSALGSWWQTTQDDWHYGRPRTFQTDEVVGHHDSPQNPSHFIAMNLNRHIVIIEIPGGDASRSVVFSGPTLLGPGQDLTPVTLTFQDVNHDGAPDMLVNVQGSQFVFLNQNGTFVPTKM